MNWQHVQIVYRKELMDLMRDRRTIIAMFLFPLIVFPIMTVGFGSVEKRVRENAKQEVMPIMMVGEQNAPDLAARIRASNNFLVVPAADDFAQRIDRKELRAAIEFSPDFQKLIESAGKPKLTIYNFTAEIRSEIAAGKLDDLVSEYRKDVLKRRLVAAHLPESALQPIETRRENVAAAAKVGGSQLAMFLPYFIIVLCLSGAMHPAMDLTAGEKERGTLETLLASAVGRRELVIGKFLMVLTVSLVTAVMSLASYLGTMSFAKEYTKQMTRGYSFSLGFSHMGMVFLLVLPLAIFFSATLLAISLSAKSYKEAQQHVGPLMILAFLPAIIAMLPGVELSPALAMVPILNVSLVAKEILTGSFPWKYIAITFASTCVFAAIALSTAVSQFRKESVLFKA